MESTRNRLEAQEVAGLGDRTLADIQFGLQFSPALCATGVAAGYLGTCSVRGGMTAWLRAGLPVAGNEAK